MSYGENFILTLFTNDPELARRADTAGINRIGLDLEEIGKAERQGQLNTWISDHKKEHLPSIRQALNNAKLFARTNPIHSESQREIDELVEQGVEVLMLPMFKTVSEAVTFVEIINGRADVSLLVETAAAAVRLEKIVELPGIDEIHIGLNDLHLDLGLTNHFELLGTRFLEHLAETVLNNNIPFGFGGIGRAHDERLPIPSELVYAQYPRLKADRALVSRVFTSPDYKSFDLEKEIALFRKNMDAWNAKPKEELILARNDLIDIARSL
jgi:hypothetical protein